MKRILPKNPMLRSQPFFLAGLAWVCLSGFSANQATVVAQQADSHDLGEPVVAVHLDLSNFAQSKLGKLLVKAGTTLAAEEMQKDPDEAMDALMKSIGFNPIEQEVKLRATVVDLENPIDGMRLDAMLKDSTGNLEGLLLAAPGYRSQEHGDHTIHSANLDGQEIFLAFLDSANGAKHVIAAKSQVIVTDAIDASNRGERMDETALTMPDGQFLRISVLELPEEVGDTPPLSGIASIVRHGSLSVSEEASRGNENELVAKITLATTNEEQSAQLQQLAQGAVAMIGIFKDEIRRELESDEVAQRVLPILDGIEVRRDGTKVHVVARMPEDLLIEFLREEADLPL